MRDKERVFACPALVGWSVNVWKPDLDPIVRCIVHQQLVGPWKDLPVGG